MAKQSELFMFCTLVIAIAIAIAIPTVRGIAKDPQSVKEWIGKLPEMEEKVTNLHFYFTDIIGGKNPTALLVAGHSDSTTPTDFSAVLIADDLLTVGPDPKSEEIGRAQGMYAQAAINGVSFLMDFNFVFTKGEYNGSTLSLAGWNSFSEEYREMSIVGGSGVFRLARGIATAKRYWFDATTLDAILEFYVVVLHYGEKSSSSSI